MVLVGERDLRTEVFGRNGEDGTGAVFREGSDMGLDFVQGVKR